MAPTSYGTVRIAWDDVCPGPAQEEAKQNCPTCLQPAVGAGMVRGRRESKASMTKSSYFGSGQRGALGQPE